MSEEQAKKKKDESKDVKEELTEDELKGVSGGDGVITDVPGNPLGSLKEELTDDELKGLPGGVGVENTGYDSAGKGQKNTHVGAYGAYNSPQNH